MKHRTLALAALAALLSAGCGDDADDVQVIGDDRAPPLADSTPTPMNPDSVSPSATEGTIIMERVPLGVDRSGDSAAAADSASND